MAKKIALLALVSFFLLSRMVVTSPVHERAVGAQPIPCPPTDREVGVTIGDWFKYGEFNVSWSSNDPNVTLPAQLEGMNETEWMSVSVQNISCTRVTLQIVKHFKDGTEKTENGSVDIETGTGVMICRIVSANLSVNDTIYADSIFSTWTVDEIIGRTYPDGERETIHLNRTEKWNITRYVDDSTINGTGQAFTNYYWDRSTGILVEYSYKVIEQVGEYITTLSTSYRIIESNVWIVPEFPTWTSAILILAVLTVAIAVYKPRLHKKPIH